MTEDTPLFRTYRKRESTLKFLLIGLAAAFLWGLLSIGYVVLRMAAASGGGLDRLFGVVGGAVMLSALVGAAVITGALYLFVGRRSGDRGGLADYGATFAVALATPVAALFLIGMAAEIGSRPLREAYDQVMLDYSAEMQADNRAFERDLEAINKKGFMEPSMLARDPGYRKTRALLEEGRQTIARYHSLSQQRRRAARGKIEAQSDPRIRLPALKMFDDQAAAAKPIEDNFWSLHETVVATSEAVIDVLARSRGRWQDGSYYFERPADLMAFRDAVDERDRAIYDLNSEVRRYNATQARALSQRP